MNKRPDSLENQYMKLAEDETPDLWKRIETELPAKKKRFLTFRTMSIIAGTCAAGLLIFLLLPSLSPLNDMGEESMSPEDNTYYAQEKEPSSSLAENPTSSVSQKEPERGPSLLDENEQNTSDCISENDTVTIELGENYREGSELYYIYVNGTRNDKVLLDLSTLEDDVKAALLLGVSCEGELVETGEEEGFVKVYTIKGKNM